MPDNPCEAIEEAYDKAFLELGEAAYLRDRAAKALSHETILTAVSAIPLVAAGYATSVVTGGAAAIAWAAAVASGALSFKSWSDWEKASENLKLKELDLAQKTNTFNYSRRELEHCQEGEKFDFEIGDVIVEDDLDDMPLGDGDLLEEDDFDDMPDGDADLSDFLEFSLEDLQDLDSF